MIDAGKRRHRMVLQAFDGTLDEANQPLLDDDAHWTDVAAVWASLQPVSGREFYGAGQLTGEETHRLDIRWRPGMQADMRLKHGARIFEIVSAIDVEERHESLLILAKERVK